MKRIFLVMLVAMVAAVSCQKSELAGTSFTGNEFEMTITANLSDGSSATRAIDNYGMGKNVTRCIMEVYYIGADGTADPELYQRMYSAVDADTKTASFDIRLVDGQTYDFLFWADCGDTSNLETDVYYTTTSLNAVSVDYTDYNTYGDKRDAFFGSELAVKVSEQAVAFDVELRRPFGQLNVFSKFTDVIDNKLVALTPTKVQYTYTKDVCNTLDVKTGIASGSETLEWAASRNIIDDLSSTGYTHLSTDYIFAPLDESGSTQTLVDFTLTFYNAAGTEIMSNDAFVNIPIQRNYRTNVYGELMTVSGDITVEVVPAFDGATDVFVPSFESVEDLNEALASYEGDGDLVIELTTAPEADGDGIIIPEDFPANSVTFDFTVAESDGSSEIIVVAENQDYDGTVIISNTSGYSMGLTVTTPNADVVVSSGSYSSFNVWSRSNTCVVLATATVEEIIVEQGNVSVYGTVGSIVKSADNNDKETLLSIFNGGSVETIGEGITLLFVPDFYNYTTNTSYEDFTSLMAAAVTNDEVYVGSGTYTYTSTNFTKALTIYGANRDIDGSAAERNPETIFMDIRFYKPSSSTAGAAVDIVIDGVELTGSSAFDYQGGGNVTVRNSIISSTTSTAGSYPINNRVVYTDCSRISGNFLFENNLFKPADEVTLNEFWIWGCKYDASSRTTDVTAVIRNNVFNSTYVNVGFSNNVQTADSKIEITGNTFENIPYEAIIASAGTANGTISITGNTFSNDKATAIDLNGDTDKFTFIGNTYADDVDIDLDL